MNQRRKFNDENKSLLCVALDHHSLDVAEKLLMKGADINIYLDYH